MDPLKVIVRHVVKGYSGSAYNGCRYLTINLAEDVFTVVGVEKLNGQRYVTIGLVVRIADGLVIIERN